MIGIIAAMNVEMESLREFIDDPVSETISGIRFVSGTIEGKEVVTAVCGVGPAQHRQEHGGFALRSRGCSFPDGFGSGFALP